MIIVDKIDEWGLYIGNSVMALSDQVSNNYTHVINCTKDIPCPFAKINYLRIPVDDVSTDNIKVYFNEVFKFVETARKLKDTILLIHCAQGCSRSPTILLSYLMLKNKWSLKQSLEYVRSKRCGCGSACICLNRTFPNIGFFKQLIELELEIGFNESSMSIQEYRGFDLSTEVDMCLNEIF